MEKVEMPHPEDNEHLCYLNNVGFQFSHAEEYKKLVRNGNCYCKNCGRVAGDKKNLCNPDKL